MLILTDDQRVGTLWAMPQVERLLVGHGIRFENAFVVNPLCCPSRASVLTGEYSHTTGVYTNNPPRGGAGAFRQDESSTIATTLQAAGYNTALFGKYLNRYTGTRIPPGWDRWFAFQDAPGRQYYVNYAVNDQGIIRSFGNSVGDYSTDVLTARAVSFIRRSRGPLFLYFAPFAPHDPATPARRDEAAFSSLRPRRTPSYDEGDVRDKPSWIRLLPRFTSTVKRHIAGIRHKQFQSLLAVDRAAARIVETLRATGRLSRTMIVFTSDNGLEWGEHRLPLLKGVPYEESIRVPMVVRYDPLTLTPLTDDRLVLNIDLAPTFAALAGVSTPGAEGRSLLPLLYSPEGVWRRQFLIEHMRDRSQPIDAPTYCAVRTDRYLYAQYATGETELYDVLKDPFELDNRSGDLSFAAIRERLSGRLAALCLPPPPGLRVKR